MKTIIIGAGKMGFNMARLLSAEEHDVVVIETKAERQKVVNENLDVQTIIGSGVESSILKMAGIQDADMLLALTEYDELNMMACIIGKNYGVKVAIARVRNTDYLESDYNFLKDKLGIDLLLNPERITAREAFEIIENPNARSVDYFADGKVQVVKLIVDEKSPLVDKQLMDLPTEYPYNIVSIIRNHETIVPRGQDYIRVDDYICVMAKTDEMLQVQKILGYNVKKVSNVCIIGGGRTGFHLAEMLEKAKGSLSIKLIEKNLARAQEISEKLDKTLVLHGDGSDFELLEEENIGDSDIFVAVSDDDQINLLSALIAQNMGAKMVIAQLKRTELMFLAEKIGIDVVLIPRVLTAGAILKYIREGEVISVTLMHENQAEMLELVAQPESKAVEQELKDIPFPQGAIIGGLMRDEQIIIPDGFTVIKAFDRLIVFTLPTGIHDVESLFLGVKKR